VTHERERDRTKTRRKRSYQRNPEDQENADVHTTTLTRRSPDGGGKDRIVVRRITDAAPRGPGNDGDTLETNGGMS
jgi:hypothetical protein